MRSNMNNLLLIPILWLGFSCQQGSSSLNMSATSKPAEVPVKDSLDKGEVVLEDKKKSPAAIKAPSQGVQMVNHLNGKFITTGLDQFRQTIENDLDKKNRQASATELAKTLIDSIESFEFRYDVTNQHLNLMLVTRIGNSVKRQLLMGIYQASPMVLVNSDKSILAKAICLDKIENQCFESYIELNFKNFNHARVGLIYRRRNANFDITSIQQLLVNPPAEKFASYLRNSSTKQGQLPWINTVVVDSFEIINGRSGFRLSLVANDGMLFSGLAKLNFNQFQNSGLFIPFMLSSDFSHIGVHLKRHPLIDGSQMVDRMFLMQTNPTFDQFTARFEFYPYRHLGGVAFDIPFIVKSFQTITVTQLKSLL